MYPDSQQTMHVHNTLRIHNIY